MTSSDPPIIRLREARSSALAMTTVTGGLTFPAELFDHIIDQLYNQLDALRVCSLVCKSWVARSQKHIFSTVSFGDELDVAAWRSAFPDPQSSPAHYTQFLTLNHPRGVPEGHISSFSNVTSLLLHIHSLDLPLTRLFGFAPSLKSLRVTFAELPFSDVLNFVYSFPLLDNLSFMGIPTASGAKVDPPPSPPPLSGTLSLAMISEMRFAVDNLLSLPGGIHFRELVIPWIRDRDLSAVMDLISACSHSLESLEIATPPRTYLFTRFLFRESPFLTCVFGVDTISVPRWADLSSAIHLRSITFDCRQSSLYVDWIGVAVETIKSPRIEKMTLYMFDYRSPLQTPEQIWLQTPVAQWLELDKVLVGFLTAHSLRLKVVPPSNLSRDLVESCVGHHFPSLFGKKMIDY